MRTVLFGWMALSLAAACKEKLPPAPPSSLDGRTFDVRLARGLEASTDRLVFGPRTLDSNHCHKYGFEKAVYAVNPERRGLAFSADTSNRKYGSVRWRGSVDGDRIEGTMTWTKPGEPPLHYIFNGEARK